MTKKVIAISCDTEFTSFDKVGGDLLSMAFVEVLEGYTLGREICLYSRATNPKYFSDKAAQVHGFSFWKALEFPKRIVSINAALQWLEPFKDLPNLPFLNYANGALDYKWLIAHFSKEGMDYELGKILQESDVVNVLKMARDNYKNISESVVINKITGKPYTKYSLRNVCDFSSIELNHHEALSDAKGCAQIWCNIMQKKNTWTGELF